ncbi:uncharacterized protein ColSpa_08296 [Colletotrichum spaethianum]|uniref:Secreted protein n=1 Tax=Colletotrichum spaethianum TaxID=700344 RepID=A0AA37P9I9_9PEZI|nr:uncharacterized protein ColSpa_08296 [Colletotrichum spaethianum]GKT48115.1 hypothetical protein ColSpa_08296 [Colletotrichum spaethianum]
MQIQVAAVLLALLPTFGWSCAVYSFCNCQNADGSFHEAATKAVCAQFAGNYDRFSDGRHYCSARVVNAGSAGGVVLDFNNCRFLSACQKHGANGGSNCWGKE